MSTKDRITVSANATAIFWIYLALLGLRLFGVTHWDWVWVTAPLWIPTGISLLVFGWACWYAWKLDRAERRQLDPV